MRTKRTREHRLFNKFLRENGCKRKFYRNERAMWDNAKFIAHRVGAGNYRLVCCSFFWDKLPEGKDYWEKIAEKWNDYFYEKISGKCTTINISARLKKRFNSQKTH